MSMMAGRDVGAVQAFQAAHRLRELALQCAAIWEQADALLLPTAPTLFTAAEIAEAPIARNALLGTYTSFVNLLDLCAAAVPAGGARRRPAVRRLADRPRGRGRSAAGIGRALARGGGGRHRRRGRCGDRGAGRRRRAPVRRAAQRPAFALGARLRETVRSAPTYRLYALADTDPAKPGLVGGGAARGDGVELEIWELSSEAFGRLVAGVPAPLSIGTITLPTAAR